MIKIISHAINVLKSKFRDSTVGRKRSPLWRKVEHAWREAHPTCAACNSTKRIQVHHKKPFHLHPELELETTNLISLCMGPNECHLLIGHGDNFKVWNPNVEADCAEVLANPTKRSTIEAAAKKNRRF